jgi:hypothetical protein
MSINEIVHLIVRPSISALELLPEIGDQIDFETPGETVYGATVIRIEDFCDTTNFLVEYSFLGRDKKYHDMTQWVALEDVR